MVCCLKKSIDGETIIVEEEDPPLLPGLPNHLAQLILSAIRPSLLYAVCRRWRQLIYTPHFPPFLSLYAIVASNSSNYLSFHSFDPVSSKWTTLPPPVTNPPLHLLYRHPSFISRNLTIQSLTAAGCLVVIAATGESLLPGLSHPLVFEPLRGGQWRVGPPLSNPRRWCAAGCYQDTVYVASGVGAQYHGEVARMVEKWDVVRDEWRWEEVAGLKDGRFSREAVEAVGYKGKICMVIGKEGVVYDVDTNRWEKMPPGMVSGWNGAVGVAKEEEELMYVVDQHNGRLSKYDHLLDSWQQVLPGSDLLKGARHMAVAAGKICVVAAGRITVLDIRSDPVRMWVVDPPTPETEVVSIHILTRPCNKL